MEAMEYYALWWKYFDLNFIDDHEMACIEADLSTDNATW